MVKEKHQGGTSQGISSFQAVCRQVAGMLADVYSQAMPQAGKLPEVKGQVINRNKAKQTEFQAVNQESTRQREKEQDPLKR